MKTLDPLTTALISSTVVAAGGMGVVILRQKYYTLNRREIRDENKQDGCEEELHKIQRNLDLAQFTLNNTLTAIGKVWEAFKNTFKETIECPNCGHTIHQDYPYWAVRLEELHDMKAPDLTVVSNDTKPDPTPRADG